MAGREFVGDSVKELFADVVSAERFIDWKRTFPSAADFLRDYVLGEIFWRKAIGRPTSAMLRDGVHLDASHEIWLLVPVDGQPTWERINLPVAASWWDGNDDEEYWRVPFLVGPVESGITNNPDPENFLFTHIVPSLNPAVRWTRPLGAIPGVKSFKPASAVFVKPEGAVSISFEIVVTPFVFFDEGGVVIKP
jgi:hypothetical protein